MNIQKGETSACDFSLPPLVIGQVDPAFFTSASLCRAHQKALVRGRGNLKFLCTRTWNLFSKPSPLSILDTQGLYIRCLSAWPLLVSTINFAASLGAPSPPYLVCQFLREENAGIMLMFKRKTQG
jgi:hypothetical protein